MSFKIPRVGPQRRAMEINLEDNQSRSSSQDRSFGSQSTVNLQLSKDEFEESLSQSFSEDGSSYWSSLRSIWKYNDHEDSSVLEKDDDYSDVLKLSGHLGDINESIDHLTNALSTSGSMMACAAQDDSVMKVVNSVKQIAQEKNVLMSKQLSLTHSIENLKEYPQTISKCLDRLFLKVKTSFSDESDACSLLPANCLNKLKESLNLYRNNFNNILRSSVSNFSNKNDAILRSTEAETITKKHISQSPKRCTLDTTHRPLSIQMKFRTPLSKTNRKLNIRSIPRTTNYHR
ncbi:unnamed protein product [Heterobilharzia americana]|nr:unnamed protein product [Heterobilharzia americana]